MKRSFKARQEIIDISDDEAPTQPDLKIVKKEVEKPPGPSPEVLELQKKVEKLEKNFQGACRIAGEAQARVDFLENLLDKKRAETGDGDKKRVHDLLDRLDEKSRQFIEAKKNAAAKEEQLLEKVNSLTQQLEAEKSRASEDRKRINGRQELLTQQLNEQVSKSNKEAEKAKDKLDEVYDKLDWARKESIRIEDKLQDRIEDLSKELEAEKSDRRRYRDRLADALDNLEMTNKEADKEEEKLQNRIGELTKELEAEKSRASEESKKDKEKLAEVSEKLEKTRKEAENKEEQLQDRINELTKLLAAEESRSNAESKKDREKIDVLTRKLGQNVSLVKMAQLQAQVDELELELQRARELARDADSRAEAAENALDAAQDVNKNEETPKELASYASQLEQAKLKEKEAISKIGALEQETNTLKAWNADTQRAIELSNAAAATLQERVNFLTFQVEAEQRRATEERIANKAEIDTLAYSLEQFKKWRMQYDSWMTSYTATKERMSPAEYQASIQAYFQQQPPVAQKEIASIPVPTVSMPPKVHDIAHPTNIFQLCHASKTDSISFDRVAVQLRAKYEECGEEGYRKYSAEKEELSLECESCGVPGIERTQVLPHLLSEEHGQKMGDKSAVSIVAYAFWFGELQKACSSARAVQIDLTSSSCESVEAAPDAAKTTSETDKTEPVKHEDPTPAAASEVPPGAPPSTPPDDPAVPKAPGVVTTPKLFGPYLYTPSPIKGRKPSHRESKNEVKEEDIIVID